MTGVIVILPESSGSKTVKRNMESILYRLFGVGKIPEVLCRELKNEGLIAPEEGMKSTITYKNFRTSGRYSNWKRRWITGGFALTEKRPVLLQYATLVVNLALADERFGKIKISREGDTVLLFAFDPLLFLENSSGEIQWRFRTVRAQEFAEAFNRK